MLKNIILTKTEYKKQGESWALVRDSHKTINEEFYNNILGAKDFMESLGGKEQHTKGATPFGRVVIKIASINPSGDYKSIYEFDFSKATTD